MTDICLWSSSDSLRVFPLPVSSVQSLSLFNSLQADLVAKSRLFVKKCSIKRFDRYVPGYRSDTRAHCKQKQSAEGKKAVFMRELYNVCTYEYIVYSKHEQQISPNTWPRLSLCSSRSPKCICRVSSGDKKGRKREKTAVSSHITQFPSSNIRMHNGGFLCLMCVEACKCQWIQRGQIYVHKHASADTGLIIIIV